MTVEIRGILPDESDDLIRASATGFGEHVSPRDVELGRSVLEPDRAVVAHDGEAFVGTANVCSFGLSVPGGSLPAAGISSVAVLPTHRRKGILRGMMRRILDDLREREPISILWASEGGIYGRYGYGMATRGAQIEIDRQHTAFRPAHAPAGSMRLLSADEAMKTLPPVYEAVAVTQPGFIYGSDAWWRYRFAAPDHRHDEFGREFFFAVHETPTGPDGYVAYRIRHDWESDGHEMRIEELAASNADAYADLSRYCFDVDLVQRFKAVMRSPEEPLVHLLADRNRLRMWVHDGLWLRLTDVRAALDARQYAMEGRLVFEVRDEFCPWNEGRYELVGGPDGAETRPTDEDPHLTVSVEELGAAYLGGISFRSLARAGRLDAAGEALRRADAMFGWDPPPWCPFVF